MNTLETRKVVEITLFAATLGIALLVGLGGGATAQAAPLGGEPGVGGAPDFPCQGRRFDAGHLPPHFQNLGLSDDQRKRIGDLFEAEGKSGQDRLETARKAHQELRELAQSDDYTDAKANALIKGTSATMAEIALDHARMDHQVYELLTPEQRVKLKDNQDRFGAWPPLHGGHRPR